ncbi:ABC-three component system protein [Clostridium kluyveri]|uniref:ABC-three component system protein n=1 Tax=Clostridium kluyveri TaxID=1534 RepID=UPI0022462CBA|nr:ABC-three component system protein [Clostridium kluyveri]UZQ49509.1 hypothetical protein OP486_16365 [Clostridium kluyveri]
MILLGFRLKLSGLKIDYFTDWLEQKMFLPYGKYPTSNENIWIGWIKFLTFMYIISGNNLLDNTNRSFDEIWNYETSARDLERIIKRSTEGVIRSVKGV